MDIAAVNDITHQYLRNIDNFNYRGYDYNYDYLSGHPSSFYQHTSMYYVIVPVLCKVVSTFSPIISLEG